MDEPERTLQFSKEELMGGKESKNSDDLSPFSGDGILAYKSFLNDINYAKYQQKYLSESIQRHKDLLPNPHDTFDAFIPQLAKYGYTLTSQFSGYKIGSFVYRAIDKQNNKVLIRLSASENEPSSLSSFLTEWYVLSGHNPQLVSHQLTHMLDDSAMRPTSLPRDIDGILYPIRAFTIYHPKIPSLKRHVLIFPDLDYVTLKEYYKKDRISDIKDPTPSIQSGSTGSTHQHLSGVSMKTPSISTYNSTFNSTYDDAGRIRDSEKSPLEVVNVLNDVLAALKILKIIHDYGILHGSLSNLCIIKSKITGKVKISGFKYAAPIKPDEYVNPYKMASLEVLEDHLPYVSPEAIIETRRNDLRSDLYSIGVILYELVVGRLPFKSDNKSQLICLHLSHKPKAPITIGCEWISEDLNRVIMCLLEKDAWKRYPDCVCLINDLVRIKNNYIDEADMKSILPVNLDSDILRKEDVCQETQPLLPFIIPRKALGRRKSFDTAVNYYNNTDNPITFVTVTGCPGSGKSALLHDMEELAITKRDFFHHFKFSKAEKESSIYNKFFMVIANCIDTILEMPKEDVEEWRHLIISKVPVDLDVLMSLIPQFRTLMGPKYSSIIRDKEKDSIEEDNAPSDMMNQQLFNLELQIRYLIKCFYGLFAEKGLTLFIDDLQYCSTNEWSMAAEIVTYLNSCEAHNDIKFKLFLVYDTTEDSVYTLDEIEEFLNSFDAKHEHIHLDAMSEEEFIEFWRRCVVTDERSLWRSDPQATSNDSMIDTSYVDERLLDSASKLYKLCKGEVYHLKIIIQSLLVDKKVTYINRRGSVKGKWEFDISELQSVPLDSTLDYFIERNAPEDVIRLLSFASILVRSSFNLSDLAIVTGWLMKKVIEILNMCIGSKLIFPTNYFYRVPFHLDPENVPFDVSEENTWEMAGLTTFCFAHISVRQYFIRKLYNSNETGKFHRLCAIRLHEYNSAGPVLISKSLIIGRHFSLSVDECRKEDRETYINGLLVAGRMALGTYSLEEALSYFIKAQKLIEATDTRTNMKVILTICQIHFYLEEFQKCIDIMNEAYLTFDFDETMFLITRIRCLSNLGQHQESFKVAIQGLAKLGLDISDEELECRKIKDKYEHEIPLSIHGIRDMKNAPHLKNTRIHLILEIASDLVRPGMYRDRENAKLALTYQCIVLMEQHGGSALGAKPLIYIANYLAKSGDKASFLRATEYVRLAMEFVESDSTVSYQEIQSIYDTYLSTIACYMEPIDDLLKYHEIFVSSTRSHFRSDITTGRDVITGMNKVYLLFFTGQSYQTLLATVDRQEHDNFTITNKIFRKLQADGLKLLHGDITLSAYEDCCDRNDPLHEYMFAYYTFKLWYYTVMEMYHEGFGLVTDSLLEVDKYIPNTMLHVDFYFALAIILREVGIDSPEKKQLALKVKMFFELWNELCSVNFQPKHLMVKAMLHDDCDMSELDVLDLFEEAIERAKATGMNYDALLGNLLCAIWLQKKKKFGRRFFQCVKNATSLSNLLDLSFYRGAIERKFGDHVKEYNWAGIDSISTPNPPTPSTPRQSSPNPLNRKLKSFFSTGYQAQPSRGVGSLRHDSAESDKYKPEKFREYSIDLNEAIQACLEISNGNNKESIWSKLLESAIHFSNVDYGVVITMRNQEPFIQAIGSPTIVYCLTDEPLSSRTDLCPFTLIMHTFETLDTVNKDEDNVIFQSKFGKDDYYKNNKCQSMICIPLLNSNGIIGAIYLERQRPIAAEHSNTQFFDAKKKDLIELLCSQANISVAKIDLYYHMEHAKRVAEDATAEKASFLANMSHEIRTPFNSLLSCSIFLLDTDLDKTQREYVETIKSSAMVTLNIIDGILAFSKIEHGSFTLTYEPFSLVESIENAIKLVGEQALTKNLELVFFNKCRNIKVIHGDQTRFRQIIINLIGNAVKFTAHGHIKVTAKSEKITESRHEVSISVEDTGIGIPKDSASKVFGAFSQVDSSSRRVYGGSGLGLAISKKLVDLMGGTLTFESTEGQGSTFYFVLNAEVELEEEPAINVKSSNLKALLVDDRLLTRESLHESLTWFGMKVDTLDNPDCLLKLDRKTIRQYDCLFFDFNHFHDKGFSPPDWIGEEIKMIVISLFGRSISHLLDDSRIYSILIIPFQEPKIIELLRILQNSLTGLESKQLPLINTKDYAIRYPLNILIAEDNLINLKVALQHLKKLGYRADHAKDGVEVIERCLEKYDEGKYYDVIFMDIQMPRKDGIATATELRQIFDGQGKLQYLPEIVALTANVAGEDRERSLKCGMTDFISKPILPDNLMNVLQKIGEKRIKQT